MDGRESWRGFQETTNMLFFEIFAIVFGMFACGYIAAHVR